MSTVPISATGPTAARTGHSVTRRPDADADADAAQIVKPTVVVADPDPVGLLSFAFPTFLANVAVLSHQATSSLVLCAAILLGGVGQILAGMQEFKGRNFFGATTFTLFGLFWVSYGFIAWIPELGAARAPGGVLEGWYYSLWALVLVALFGASFALNRVLTLTLAFVWLLLVFSAVGAWTGLQAIDDCAAVFGIISALLAVYLGLAQMWSVTYGRVCLPVYPWRNE
jgi:succinate-acetate transporter protein